MFVIQRLNYMIKANANKSTHITFTLNRETFPVVTLNGQYIPQRETAKYLGIHLDRRLTWQKHIHQKKTLRWSRGSVLAFGTQVRGFKPGRSRRIFKGK